MESFTFNNVYSESLDIIVKEMPLVPRAQKNIESISVNGRNGALHIDNKNYLPINYTIDCISKNKDKVDEINSKLIGTHQLTLSKYPGRYWNATIKNQITFAKYLTYFNEFPLQFELDPIAYSIEETTETLESNASILVEGNVETYPIITISGVGSVIINGYTLIVNESDITIDCNLMQCYMHNISKNDMVELDEFPKLKVGINDVVLGEGIEKVVIKYRKGWL